MAKLITETSNTIELWESKSKTPYMIGVFASSETRNANGRVYKKPVLEREIDKFCREKIATKTSWGEMQHPENSEINLENVAIMIESLEWRGNDVYGKAKILDTPKGNILKVLMKEGSIGVSTRGLGTVSENGQVNDDYRLITIDAVADASNPGSRFMNGILEGRTFELPSERMTIAEAEDKYIKYQIDAINRMIRTL